MRIILGESASTSEAVDDTRLLVAVDRAEFEQSHRQIAVGTTAAAEDQIVERTVHRFEVVVLPGLTNIALGVQLLIHRDGGIHALGIPIEVSGGLEKIRLSDMR